jgi:hypothetical protein
MREVLFALLSVLALASGCATSAATATGNAKTPDEGPDCFATGTRVSAIDSTPGSMTGVGTTTPTFGPTGSTVRHPYQVHLKTGTGGSGETDSSPPAPGCRAEVPTPLKAP